MNDVEWNALFQPSDKGLLKARVSRIEVAMATSVKRASDLTTDQSINLGIPIFFFYLFIFLNQRFTHDSQLIAVNKKKKRGRTEIVGT